MLNKDNIDQLLLKHLLQENAVEEEQLLKEWLGHDPEHQRYFERFRRHHIHLQAAIQSGRIQGQYIEFASRLKRRHIRRLFIRVAAIALILLGGGLSFYLIHTPSLIPTLAEVPIHPGSSKAILHLSSGTAIPVNTTSQELKEKDGTLIRISNEGVLNYAESANISTANLINRLEIPRGGEFKIKLADGTEVWLNAETELRYPTVFSSLERRVKLQGEGYFKVAKNEKQPFIVEVGDIEVKVYGTQFNISTQNKDNIETVLVSGRLDDQHHDQHQENDGIGQLGRDIGLAQVLDDTQQDAAQKRARDRADTAEDRRHERLDAGHGTGGGLQSRIGGAEQRTGHSRQRRADGEGQRDRCVDIDAHQLGRAAILGHGKHGMTGQSCC